ncbi:GNAT family N-acetyltransferase [Actinoplanes sp. GCM10030250]|uniref:GNAT family N-acetyltransferase n=1 Tax=Actinoplanes sp. GCM10030250 TaxID=3273376 RepID=UPI0036229C87
MAGPPVVLCRPDGLHVAESPRLWIVTGRASDHARWQRLVAGDPVAGGDWPVRLRHALSESPFDAVADPLDADQPLLPDDPNHLFFAGIDQHTSLLVAGVVATTTTGVTEVGGVVQRDCRGRGFGHEMLGEVCRLLHGHFGVARLVAGCEEANLASRAWLAGAGFTPAAGAPAYRLANGRPARPMWWERIDAKAVHRCRRPGPSSR